MVKYLSKGCNMVTVKATGVIDEVEQFQTCRYVSSCEAAWWLFEFDIVSVKPPVFKLPVHLENQNCILYENNVVAAQEALDTQKQTPLTGFFKANSVFVEANDYSYEDFPQRFTWNTRLKEWTLQKERVPGRDIMFEQIGRMVACHPSQGEQFFLRLLLKHKSEGKTSFKDLRTVNNVELPTFKAACIAYHLLQDDIH